MGYTFLYSYDIQEFEDATQTLKRYRCVNTDLLSQGLVKERLVNFPQKFIGKYQDLVQKYSVSCSHASFGRSLCRRVLRCDPDAIGFDSFVSILFTLVTIFYFIFNVSRKCIKNTVYSNKSFLSALFDKSILRQPYIGHCPLFDKQPDFCVSDAESQQPRNV